ncbi:hypothetical protein [Streptomyces sp. SHP 1-2]|uniref:hypothetical protein n=1 Tax=Streptomyces sp. SHP 1-2 TaxID=2769489 RepID=UPI002238B493|nr:hypothetical protein [Streptomyces sp. SHP 1-2]MCW5252489.1 hypothetical protein [Streptomyces sp. SHP 1-2]
MADAVEPTEDSTPENDSPEVEAHLSKDAVKNAVLGLQAGGLEGESVISPAMSCSSCVAASC